MPNSIPQIARPLAFFLLILLLASAGGAASLVVPPIEVEVVSLEGQQPSAGVEVELLVREGKRDDFVTRLAVRTDASGKVRFDTRSEDKAREIALRFTWRPEGGAPPRQMRFEVSVKKGAKIQGGRLVEPGRWDSRYRMADGFGGDCDNLFVFESSPEVYRVRFLRPPTYAKCQENHVFKASKSALLDQEAIGLRDINKGTFNLYPFEADVQMGQQFTQEMGPEQPLLDDPIVNDYVRDLVRDLGRASDMPGLEYQVQVVDADVLNAFALPGGYVFVYRGLIEASENESELAGVMAHELAHVTGRHGTEGVTSGMAKMLGAMVLGGVAAEEITDNRTAQQLIVGAVMQGTNLWVLGGGRRREAEADRLGAQYAWRAGYDPRGLGTFFEKLSAQRKDDPRRLDVLFSSHPSDASRVAAVEEMVDYFLPPRGGLIGGTFETSSDGYKAAKKRLSELPPPKMAGEAVANKLFSSFADANSRLMWGEFMKYLEAGAPPIGAVEDEP